MQSLLGSLHVVKGIAPQDVNGSAVSGDYISLKDYQDVLIVINLKGLAGAMACTLTQATAVAGTGAKTLGFDHHYISGANDDTYVKTTVSSDTFNVASTDDNMTILIPVLAENLDVDNEFDCLRVNFADPGASNFVAVDYILGNGAYNSDPASRVSAITD